MYMTDHILANMLRHDLALVLHPWHLIAMVDPQIVFCIHTINCKAGQEPLESPAGRQGMRTVEHSDVLHHIYCSVHKPATDQELIAFIQQLQQHAFIQLAGRIQSCSCKVVLMC